MTPVIEAITAANGAWSPFITAVILKSAVVLLVAYLVTLALGGASASVRHHVWTLAFVIVVILPLLSGALPAWHVEVPGWQPPPEAVAITEWSGFVAGRAGGSVRLEGAPSSLSREGDAAGDPEVAATAGSSAADLATVPDVRSSADGVVGTLLEWLRAVRIHVVVLWLVGTGLLLAHVALGIVSAWWTSRRASPVEDPGWRDLVAAVKEELGVSADVDVRRSSRVGTPMTWGIVHPVLLLPDEAQAWSEERRRAVALHELAHVRRRDCLVHLLAQVARAIHWVNPLAWVGASRIRRERERACDDLVLKAGTSGPDYAELLLDVARSQHARRAAWGAVSMARPSQLEGRLLAILDPSRDRRVVGRAASFAAFLVAAVTVVPLAAVQAAPAPATVSDDDRVLRESRVANDESAEWTTAPDVAEEADATARNDARSRPRTDATMEVDERQSELPVLAEPLAPAESDTIEQRIVSALARALQSERADLRSEAASSLGSTESPLAIGPLSAVLQDESAEVRKEAVWALGMIESTDAVEGLLRVLAEDPAPAVRKEAAWALGMIEDPGAVRGLAAALAEEGAGVQGEAVWALGMIESPEAVRPLLGVLRDARVEIRKEAAWALGMIEDSAATGALIDALEDESEGVAEQAMWALGQVSG